MDLDDLFNEGASDPRYQEAPKDYKFADNLVKEIEAEYTGENTTLLDREKEREKLRGDLANSKHRLRKIKNPRGIGSVSRRMATTKRIAEKRAKLRQKISIIKIRLDEIAIEAGEPIEAEKKEQLEEQTKQLEELQAKQKEAAKAKLGGWGCVVPYEDDTMY